MAAVGGGAVTRAVVGALAALVVVVGAGVAPAGAQDPGGADGPPTPVEPAAGEAVPGRYIVRFSASTEPRAKARAVDAGGPDVVEVYTDVFPGAAVDATEDEIAELARDPRVVAIEEDQVVGLAEGAAPPAPDGGATASAPPGPDGGATASAPPGPDGRVVQTTPPWGLDRIDQRQLPLSGYYNYDRTGSGVTAYIVDTGIRASHVDFGSRVFSGFDAIGGGTNDCHGHGTHVAGTVGGSTWGVAKGVALRPVRVLGCTGQGTNSGVIAGLDWIVRHHGSGPAVANASLGTSASSSVDLATQRVISDGVTFVAAAGNDGQPACYTSPARVGAAVTVAASGSSDTRASFSNYGSCVDLFAPGVSVTSAGHTSNTATRTSDGTSMAAPHVAGAAALLLQQYPSWSPAQVASRLASNATGGIIGSPGSGTPNRLLHIPTVLPSRPGNDGFAAATAFSLTGPNPLSATNVEATREVGEPNHAGRPATRSVWWRFTAPSTGSVTVTTAGSSFDTLLGVYRGTTVGGLTQVAANDDESSAGVLTSRVTFTATAGLTYHVAVDGYGGAIGTIRLGFAAGTRLPWEPFATWAPFVDRQFRDVVSRPPTAAESSSWVGQLTSGARRKGDLVDSLRRSNDNATFVDPTARLYRALLGRAPDVGGLRYWIERRRSGAWSLVRMADHFAGSQEFRAKYGSLSNRQFVVRIYTDVLGRVSDPAGVGYWTAELDSGRRSRGKVMVGFSESSEYKQKQAHTTDVALAFIALMNRTPTAAETTTWVARRTAGTTHVALLTEMLNGIEYGNRHRSIPTTPPKAG